MKLFLVLLLATFTFADWEPDISTDKQYEVIAMSYFVGEEKGLGLELAAISLVETQAGLLSFKNNHICGPHQIDIRYADVPCKTLESNPYVSAKLALENLLSWRYGIYTDGTVFIRPMDKMIRMYNVGYTNHPHQWKYLARYKKALKYLKPLLKGL